MELNINDDVLLLGEANFSFTLSLIKYCNPKFITTTCYESKEDACKRYGTDLVETNLSLLNTCKRVLFEIDACKLETHFTNETFKCIIFMFPHYSGRSNLKKNRQLIDNFLASSRKVMRSDSCLYITLAKGQGGSSFEEDPLKRNNKDSWQILKLSSQNGFILTDCYVYNQEKFDSYKSTGFRSQSKSFHTKSGLVHKLEPSLPIFLNEISLSKSKPTYYLDKSFKFIHNLDHPLNELSFLITNNLSQTTDCRLNIIEDNLSLNLTNLESNLKVDQASIEYYKLNSNQYYLRDSLVDILTSLNLELDVLNVLNGLVFKRHNYALFETVEQLNNIEHELLIYFKSNESFIEKAFLIKKCLLTAIYDIFKNLNKEYNLDEILKFKIDLTKQELVSIVNTSSLSVLLFGLNDKRLLYSEDSRVLVLNENKELKLNKIVRAYSIESPKWLHDLSFWFDLNEFNYNEFICCVRDVCFDLVKSIRMLDLYKEESRQAVCLRLEYESCDRALSWKQTVDLQYILRDYTKLKFNKLILR